MLNVSAEQLAKVVIRPEELTELLKRLAMADGTVEPGESTIRDVAELTEASPVLIARILADIRGPDAVEQLESKVEHHEVRIGGLEKNVSKSKSSSSRLNPQEFERHYRIMERRKLDAERQKQEQERPKNIALGVVFTIIVLIVLVVGSAKNNERRGRKPALTDAFGQPLNKDQNTISRF